MINLPADPHHYDTACNARPYCLIPDHHAIEDTPPEVAARLKTELTQHTAASNPRDPGARHWVRDASARRSCCDTLRAEAHDTDCEDWTPGMPPKPADPGDGRSVCPRCGEYALPDTECKGAQVAAGPVCECATRGSAGEGRLCPVHDVGHPDDPPHIWRADLIAALELIAITDPAQVLRVVITPDHVEVTRAVRAPTGGVLLDVLKDDVVTTTTRIEVR